ncbi:PilZ domain-containing protein [Piscirickettsia litoralis]|uniref:Pilus assembly protein PilZ n=1 Tax=Piscirickettsia litoralis TaxID=1891921 RepID=A0ABX3A3T4_9GAMM|nr:PilZ domain-containing protein [Piscirickettsia litoralis]ODN43299.1 pilus assembly protein PilZ [Piscirickettsia litoralis]
MIELCCHSVAKLRAVYLPFIQKGGLFIRMTDVAAMGTKVELKLSLPDQSIAMVTGHVVWRVPIATEVFAETGVGVQLTCLAGLEIAEKIKMLLN